MAFRIDLIENYGRLDTRIERYFLTLTILFAALCVVSSVIIFPVKVLLLTILLGILLGTVFCWKPKWSRLVKTPQGWALQEKEKPFCSVELKAHQTYVSAYFIFLNGFFVARSEKIFRKKFSLILCRWLYSEQEWREWQLLLRITDHLRKH